jgi:hypothetical protein
MSFFQRAQRKPIVRSEARLSRGASVIAIGVLSGLGWVLLISIVLALWEAL